MREHIFVNILLLLVPLIRCDIMQAPIVSLEMTESGFHRNLQYTVQFDYPLAGKDCEYVLQQLLPAAVYVSVDQLEDLKRLKKLNAIYPKFVDIEVSTEKAHPFSVLLKGIPKITDSFKLPIHFRYHAPSDKSSTFVTVEINNPIMYMRCPDDDDDLSYTGLQATPSVNYCLVEESSSLIESSSNLYAADVDDCSWKLINANTRLKSPLTASIPIGNEKAYPPILYATIIVSWIVSLWTVFRTREVPRRINQKLEEQRVLKNKLK